MNRGESVSDNINAVRMTRQQFRVISRVFEGTSDVKFIRIAPAHSERVDYQVHYRDGTFGSHVQVTREGSVR
jgi:hypothetical protein